MPSIVPSYIYTLFASILIGALVICMCGVSAVNMRVKAEKQQLVNVAEYIAAQSNELILHATRDNANSSVYLNVPSNIGNQKYWVQIANDSSRVWVEAGFGAALNYSEQRAYIPCQVSASGVYTSFSGSAILECQTDSSGVNLTIRGVN
jgi:hypothetical protein